ncbi:MAG TPA: diacylglycerol kinase, partial [Ktedonobacter sp.]|nr:diacylglycerol kinase [Ktedonobacter sp.]
MRCKKACLVINPRSGQNIVKLPDVMAVLSAAGWDTDIAIKEYGGHTMELANEAAEKGYDLVIGYGGDGTLSQVVNGVMNAKGQHSIVGLIPGGTANVWASEIGLP